MNHIIAKEIPGLLTMLYQLYLDLLLGLKLLKKSLFYLIPQISILDILGGWVRVKLIIYVRRTFEVRCTLWLNLFQHPRYLHLDRIKWTIYNYINDTIIQ